MPVLGGHVSCFAWGNASCPAAAFHLGGSRGPVATQGIWGCPVDTSTQSGTCTHGRAVHSCIHPKVLTGHTCIGGDSAPATE